MAHMFDDALYIAILCLAIIIVKYSNSISQCSSHNDLCISHDLQYNH